MNDLDKYKMKYEKTKWRKLNTKTNKTKSSKKEKQMRNKAKAIIDILGYVIGGILVSLIGVIIIAGLVKLILLVVGL